MMMRNIHPPRHLRRWVLGMLTCFSLFLIYLVLTKSGYHAEEFETMDGHIGIDPSLSSSTTATECTYLRGMDEVLVVLKTGTTEALEKVPVHIETTLRCVSHYVIFSDYEEEVAGVHTYDILRSVSEETKRTNSDFQIYNRLHTLGRRGLIPEDWRDDINGPSGKPLNPGWKLDKWKFVPMIDEALQVTPDAQWYIFIEADSYIIWPNMASWLSRFDPEKPYYLGSPMQIGDETFAYGGSGIVLSNPAMRLISQYRAEHFTDIEKLTADSWAGDHVLGKILHDLDVPLVRSWPMLLPSRVREFQVFTEIYGRRPWCYLAVSFHHMTPEDIQDMWLFEQQWFSLKPNSVLLHRDIFKVFTYGMIISRKDEWDNFSPESLMEQGRHGTPTTADECARGCALTTDCLQFSFGSEGCFVSKTVVGGVRQPGVHSGWMLQRVKAILRNTKTCSQAQYIIE